LQQLVKAKIRKIDVNDKTYFVKKWGLCEIEIQKGDEIFKKNQEYSEQRI